MTAPVPMPRSHSELVSLSEADLTEVAIFIAARSGRDNSLIESHLRWFLLENPARRTQDPLGFGLRSEGDLVGCILLSPQMFRFASEKIRLLGSSSFYVDDRHRGHGGRIFLQYCRLAKQHPLFGTSANADAAALWKAAGANPIPYSDAELFGVLNWPPVAEEYVHRLSANPALARLAATPASLLAGVFRRLRIDQTATDALRPLASAEEANDLPIHGSSPKLTSLRDLPYLRWRYFSGRDSTVAVFAFGNQNSDQDVLVTVNQRPRGYRGQINALHVLDIYPEVPVEEWLQIVSALVARYKKEVDAVVLRSLNPEQQTAFAAKGFQRRAFAAPNGWFLDKSKLLPTQAWYPVPADGDGLI